MSELARCSSCEGFVPNPAARCPNCGAPAPALAWWMQRAGLWLKAAGGGAVAMTLMACYGPPPGEYRGEPDPAASPDAKPDAKPEAKPDAKPEGTPDAKTPTAGEGEQGKLEPTPGADAKPESDAPAAPPDGP